MPDIEQAKGILMAQCRCGPDEAFDLLRRASQSANVKVSVVAARLVRDVATGGRAGTRAGTSTVAVASASARR
jgi:ANTAR domain